MSIIQDQLADTVQVGDLMIPGEKVAHVQINNPLEHALLVLVRSGYSAVPVLDPSYKLKGIISKTTILNEVLGLERFEMEHLTNMQVQDYMLTDIPHMKKTDSFMDGLKMLIDHTFVCVASETGTFDGILTRRAILKRLNREFYETRANEKRDK